MFNIKNYQYFQLSQLTSQLTLLLTNHTFHLTSKLIIQKPIYYPTTLQNPQTIEIPEVSVSSYLHAGNNYEH